jgi:hypothetical protein
MKLCTLLKKVLDKVRTYRKSTSVVKRLTNYILKSTAYVNNGTRVGGGGAILLYDHPPMTEPCVDAADRAERLVKATNLGLLYTFLNDNL